MLSAPVPTPVRGLLLELASQEATGCLTIADPAGETAQVWFRDGLIYSVSVPGRSPLLGARLLSAGAISPESLAEALEYQQSQFPDWRLGDVLVHLSFVDRIIVEAFATEQIRDRIADLMHWPVAHKKFRNGDRVRPDISPSHTVTELLDWAHARDTQWEQIVPFIGGADFVPILASAVTAPEDISLDPYDWALLCKVDGERQISELADECGFTVVEAGLVVLGLIDAGLVQIVGMDSPVFGLGLASGATVPDEVATRAADVNETVDVVDDLADVVSLDDERAERERAAEDQRVERARQAAEQEQAALAAAEQERLAQEERQAAEERRAADERQAAEAARLLDEAHAAEQARLAEEARLAEKARLAAEQVRLVEEARLAEAEARIAAEEARAAHDAWEAEQAILHAQAMLAPVPTIDDSLEPSYLEPVSQAFDELRSIPDQSSYPQVDELDHLERAAANSTRSPVLGTTLQIDPGIDYLTNFSPDTSATHSGEVQRVEGADMAALMRELSSLNSFGEDEPVSQVISRPVAPVTAAPRKKKGFFGK